ncbi:hypothetical protein AB0M36_01720 [Actinoplanes sp. NPDC051346]|uniref:hypothetical protein n=1 Tax=Actinoplanes sp. NPDC051346 TaxID=3155048 RepID=UPI003418842D
MTEKAIAPGSGTRLRSMYQRYLVVAGLVLLVVLPVVFGTAFITAKGQTIITVAVGMVAAVVSETLLIAALMRGRTSVAADVLSLPSMRFSGALALGAEVAGWGGALGALTLGMIQRMSDINLAFTMGIAAAIGAMFPAVLSGAARRLSQRLTAGPDA